MKQVSTIVVTGIRAALETAAETKRRADTFVDSVTASDVTSLPDMSVAEALQRVPGVTVSRFPTTAVLRLTSRHRKAAAT